MGMFDSVYVTCSCGSDVEFQSKSGACACASYTLENAPFAIAADIIGSISKCGKCGDEIAIHGKVFLLAEQRPK